MTFEQLATIAVTSAIPFLLKSGEAVADGVGKDLWELIKKPFKSPTETILLKRLENNPNDKNSQEIVIKTLNELLKKNPEIAHQIEIVVNKNQSTNIQEAHGNENINIQDNRNSQITINR